MAKIKPTVAEIVADLLCKAERDGVCKLNLIDINRDPFCMSVYYIRMVFPDAADAIRAAGLYPARPNDADLIRSLWKFVDEHNRFPRALDALNGLLVYDADTYKSHFGNSWQKVRAAAKMIDDEDDLEAAIEQMLVQEFVEMYGESGYLPAQREHDEKRPVHNAQFVRRHIGSWERLAELTGLKLTSTSLRCVHANATRQAQQAASS